MTDEALVTVPQAAALVGRPAGTVSYWVDTGRLAAELRHTGRRTTRLVRPVDVRAVAAQMDAAPKSRGQRGKHANREPKGSFTVDPEPITVPPGPLRVELYRRRVERGYAVFSRRDARAAA